jgi:hypothetical protein
MISPALPLDRASPWREVHPANIDHSQIMICWKDASSPAGFLHDYLVIDLAFA